MGFSVEVGTIVAGVGGVSVGVGASVAGAVGVSVGVGNGVSEATGGSICVVLTPQADSISPIDIASLSLMKSRREIGLEGRFSSDIDFFLFLWNIYHIVLMKIIYR